VSKSADGENRAVALDEPFLKQIKDLVDKAVLDHAQKSENHGLKAENEKLNSENERKTEALDKLQKAMETLQTKFDQIYTDSSDKEAEIRKLRALASEIPHLRQMVQEKDNTIKRLTKRRHNCEAQRKSMKESVLFFSKFLNPNTRPKLRL
jgi:predicted RNase H-like nuclease (RuvC/YqgF family)